MHPNNICTLTKHFIFLPWFTPAFCISRPIKCVNINTPTHSHSNTQEQHFRHVLPRITSVSVYCTGNDSQSLHNLLFSGWGAAVLCLSELWETLQAYSFMRSTSIGLSHIGMQRPSNTKQQCACFKCLSLAITRSGEPNVMLTSISVAAACGTCIDTT